MAVVIVAWTAVLEHDHRADRRVALDVGDVVALDALRRALEVEGLGERRKHRPGAAAGGVRPDAKVLEALFRGPGPRGHEGSPAAAPRHLDRHGAASVLAPPNRDQ